MKALFNSALSKYWSNKLSDICSKDNEKIFKKLNPIFRPFKSTNIPILLIPNNNLDLLNSASIDIRNNNVNNKNMYIITDPLQKLNFFGDHLPR